MFKRTLAAMLATGLLTVAAPSASQAMVADRPASRYPSFDGLVSSIAHRGSTIYVGGRFSSVTGVNGTYTRHGAAAIEATTGRVLRWNPRVAGKVLVVRPTPRGVFLGGEFTSVKGEPRRNLARVSLGGRAALHPRVRTRVNGVVNAIAVSKRRVFLGGSFSFVNGVERQNLAAITSEAPFSLVRRWRPRAAEGQVKDLIRTRSGVYVAGTFRTLNGDPSHAFLALVTARRGAIVQSFNPDTAKSVLDISATKRRLYVGVGGTGGGGAMAVARDSGAQIFNRRFDGDVQAITSMRRQVYVGGHFTEICNGAGQGAGGVCLSGSTARRRGASLRLDGTLSGWNPALNGDLGITALDRYKAAERLLVGGDFTSANSGQRQVGRFAVFHSAS